MKYLIKQNKIIIEDLSQFNIEQIMDCGQIFRYFIANKNLTEVVSTNHYAQIITNKNNVEIITSDVEYFVNFFDLNRDYNEIKTELNSDEFLAESLKFGYGIRILNQDVFEMIVSFIISANNNIKRIKNSLNVLSQKFGTKLNTNIDFAISNSPLSVNENGKVSFYAFPTLEQLKMATIEDFVKAGLGYRATYMYHTIQNLTLLQLEQFKQMDFNQQLEFLLNLKGVGEKVAHCILLFSTHQTNVFPVDTWINKVYNDLTKTSSTNRKMISKVLTAKYGHLSGYAQQYFFYYYRNK